MSNSLPILTPSLQRWMIRVLTGNSAGKEFYLPYGRLILGSDSATQIQILSPGILPKQCEFNLDSNDATIFPIGKGTMVNGRELLGQLAIFGGDIIQIGGIQLQVIDNNTSFKKLNFTISPWMAKLPKWLQLPIALGVLSSLLLSIMLLSGNLRLVPITSIVCASFVPVGTLCYVFEKYGSTAVSIKSILITVGLGATLGVVVTFILGIFAPDGNSWAAAPFFEEPAKLIATIWCWYKISYRSPLCGLILGFAAGTGFAITETAGYFVEGLSNGDFSSSLLILFVRSFLSPFGHGIWTACVASAWFQIGWQFKGHWQPVFLRAILIAVGLHFLWNLPFFAFPISAFFSIMIFNKLLQSKGAWSAKWSFQP